MTRIVVLGGGAAGTVVANRLDRALGGRGCSVTVVDRDPMHHYQPGYLFVPFGALSPREILRPKRDYLDPGVSLAVDDVVAIDLDRRVVETRSGSDHPYDFLVVATGCRIAPEEVPGLEAGWGGKVHSFYTLESAEALARAFEAFERGRLVIDVAELPIKCPAAPLELAFLADAFFRRRGLRAGIEIELLTPLSGAFTKPVAADLLGGLLEARGIAVTPHFALGEVDARRGVATELAAPRREVPFDLLVAIPPNLGDPAVARSPLDDVGAGYVATDPHTLAALASDRVFAVGDAADLPVSKAGSVAHFSAGVLCENLIARMEGREPTARFDGQCDCFIASGFDRSILVHYDYAHDPSPGGFPYRGLGPFSMLRPTRLNNAGKLAFRWMYWSLLRRGGSMPFEGAMSSYFSRAA